jgi:polyvinyl alcohol dehydrogenase (cytochrome)
MLLILFLRVWAGSGRDDMRLKFDTDKLPILGLLLSLMASSASSFAVEAPIDAMFSAGEKHFQTYCAGCHLGAMPEAPKVDALRLYPSSRIVEALESGVMSTVGLSLSKKDKQQVAYYLTGKLVEENRQDTHFSCQENAVITPKLNVAASWNGWGSKASNARYQHQETLLSPANVKDLKLKWAFAFPQATRVRAQPVVTPQMTYIGSQEGIIYALDTETGCAHWQYQAESEVRGAVYLHHDDKGVPKALLFGDFKANVYALDAQTGALLWRSNVAYHTLATVTGSVIADQHKVYIPISSSEVIPAARPDYECCTFRGGLVALDIDTGQNIWTTYTTEEPKPTGESSVGTKQFGPSGAPIWSGPTLDAKRGLIYATTGQNYSSPATGTSDSVLAIDTNNGEIKWVTQVTKDDAWNGACIRKTPNCPKENGPDFDIGASAMLVTDKSGKDRLIIGQKSAMVYALDPDNKGKILWQLRLGSGGTMGGVHWGMSSDGQNVYAGVSDLPTNNPYKVGEPQPGLNAIDLVTGVRRWHYTPPNICSKEDKYQCFNGISAAVSSSPGLVYFGGLDGMFRITDEASGEVLWEFNTKQEIETSNGVKGYGGAIESDGPVIANGEVFVTSGYDKWGEAPGNLLLVFSIGGK